MHHSRAHTSIKFFILYITIQLYMDLAAGSSGISDEDIKIVREDALKWHNIFRTWHKDTPPMTLDEEMNKEAQAWAEVLAKKDEGLEHSKGRKDGENLYMEGGNDVKSTGEKAAKFWWEEFCDTKKWPRGKLNHFTQLVWKDSTTLGIGVAKGSTHVYVVGRYRKRGNIVGRDKQNVLPIACDESSVCDGMKLRKPTKESGQCGAGSGVSGRRGGADNRHGDDYYNMRGSLAFVTFSILLGGMLGRAAFTL